MKFKDVGVGRMFSDSRQVLYWKEDLTITSPAPFTGIHNASRVKDGEKSTFDDDAEVYEISSAAENRWNNGAF